MRMTLIKDVGGSGYLSIDSLENTNSPKTIENDLTKIISSFSIDNNPFSPNADGFKDSECQH